MFAKSINYIGEILNKKFLKKITGILRVQFGSCFQKLLFLLQIFILLFLFFINQSLKSISIGLTLV